MRGSPNPKFRHLVREREREKSPKIQDGNNRIQNNPSPPLHGRMRRPHLYAVFCICLSKICLLVFSIISLIQRNMFDIHSLEGKLAPELEYLIPEGLGEILANVSASELLSGKRAASAVSWHPRSLSCVWIQFHT